MTSTAGSPDEPRLARVEIAGPGANLLNPEVMAGLERALLDADADAEVSGILLTGAGESFCGGLDIAAVRAGGDPVEFASALVRLLRVFPLLRTPIAAAVNGDALASGASLVAVCDVAFTVPSARLGTVEVSLGVWPMVAQVPLIHRIGPRWAMENIGSGEPFSAERAREVGLVTAIAADGDVETAASRWLRAAARGGAATSAGRPAFHRFAGMPYDAALDAALEQFSSMFRAAD